MGKAGQFALMSELARRGYNVAIPEVDVGDDILVFNDDTGEVTRIQVKTSIAKPGDKVQSYQFAVRESAVTVAQNPDPIFAFVLRRPRSGGVPGAEEWRFLLMRRDALANYYTAGAIGTKREQDGEPYVQITFSEWEAGKHAGKVMAGPTTDLSQNLNDFSMFPPLA